MILQNDTLLCANGVVIVDVFTFIRQGVFKQMFWSKWHLWFLKLV